MSDCIRWDGGHDSDGYGWRFYLDKWTSVHRAAFHEANGYWPNVCRHTCDVRDCYNAEHLLDGTHEDNMQDMVTRGRSPLGERNTKAKLTEAQVREIRALRSSGVAQEVVAQRFGIRILAVSRIHRRVTWKHLENEGGSPE